MGLSEGVLKRAPFYPVRAPGAARKSPGCVVAGVVFMMENMPLEISAHALCKAGPSRLKARKTCRAAESCCLAGAFA